MAWHDMTSHLITWHHMTLHHITFLHITLHRDTLYSTTSLWANTIHSHTNTNDPNADCVICWTKLTETSLSRRSDIVMRLASIVTNSRVVFFYSKSGDRVWTRGNCWRICSASENTIVWSGQCWTIGNPLVVNFSLTLQQIIDVVCRPVQLFASMLYRVKSQCE